MSILAIKGHPTRGYEVIELLEVLGGKNRFELDGRLIEQKIGVSYYTVIDGIITFMMVERGFASDFKLYSLEEFEVKFPYKVRDVIQCIDDDEKKYEIVSMRWTGSKIKYDAYGLNCINNLYSYDVEKLKPYKGVDLNKLQTMLDNALEKETSETLNKFMNRNNILNCSSYKGQETMKKEIIYDEIDFNRCPCADKVQLILGDDYEVKIEDGKTYVVRKKPKYPKTYEECCNIVGFNIANVLCLTSTASNEYDRDLLHLLGSFRKLLICRDAYWKIAGEQMGLGKSWEPDWYGTKQPKFGIHTVENQIKYITLHVLKNLILVFPTEELRDAFYENFKELIEACKELL